MTLREDTEVLYLVSDFDAPDYGHSLRWHDPRCHGVELLRGIK